MISIEDCVELAMRGLEVYVHGSAERLIQAGQIKRYLKKSVSKKYYSCDKASQFSAS